MRTELLLTRRRKAAEKLMVDTCIIERPGEPVTDPDTGNVTDSMTTIYTGKCKVQSKDSATATPDAAGASFVIVSRQVHIPMNAADVLDGDVVKLTSARMNDFTVGKQYRVEGYEPDSLDTAARMPVKIL
jgi:hypothetical protein